MTGVLVNAYMVILHGFCFLLIFLKFTFKKFFQEYHQSVKPKDPDQDQSCVGADLGSNCLQRLSADDNSKQKLKPKS